MKHSVKTHKICPSCKLCLSVDNFWPYRRNKSDTDWVYVSRCKKCSSLDFKKKWNSISKCERQNISKKNRNKLGQKYFKRWRLNARYGLSFEAFEMLLIQQDYKCYVCLRDITGVKAQVDHNHKTGVVRKLLCSNCNSALGLLGENIELFDRCISYLREHNNV